MALDPGLEDLKFPLPGDRHGEACRQHQQKKGCWAAH